MLYSPILISLHVFLARLDEVQEELLYYPQHRRRPQALRSHIFLTL